MNDHLTAPLMSFPERRQGGRPRISEEESTSVSTRLPISHYNRLFAIATARRTTIAGLLRDVVILRLK